MDFYGIIIAKLYNLDPVEIELLEKLRATDEEEEIVK